MNGTLRPLVAGAILAAVTAALLPLFSVFAGVGWFLRLESAAIVALVVAWAVETRWPDREIPILSLATAGCSVLWALLVVHRSAFASDPLAGEVWSLVGDGFLEGWGELLSAAEPTADLAAAQTLLGFLIWFGVAAAVHVAVRYRSPFGVLFVTALLVWISAAAALGSDAGGIFSGVVVAAACLFTIAAIGQTEVDELRARRVAALGATVVGAGVLGAGLVALTEPVQRDPIDPRDARDTTVQTLEVPDLLSEFGGRGARTETVLTVDRVLGDPEAPIRLRVQVFGAHDGRRFLPLAEYVDVTRLTQSSERIVGDQYVLDIEVISLDEPFVPTVDRVVRADLTDLGWDPETQTAIRANRPRNYQVSGAVTSPEDVTDPTIDRAVTNATYLALPENIPSSFRSTALAVIADATDDQAAVQAIVEAVRSLGRDPSAPSGHALGRLETDLVEQRAGSAEQLAAIQTLLLRSAGIPARPVVGYIATGSDVPGTALDVWVEVPYAGVGWIPTESVRSVLEAPVEGGDQVTTTTIAEASDVAAQAQPRELGPSTDPLDLDGDGGGLSLFELILLLVVVVVALIAALVAARVLRRRLRRDAQTSDERVLGAWAELIDRLREAGLRPAATSTVSDVVELTAGLDIETRAAAESLAASTAEVFHAAQRSTPKTASSAWEDLEEIEGVLREQMGRRFDLRRIGDPRVLRHRAPLPPVHRDGGRRRIYARAD